MLSKFNQSQPGVEFAMAGPVSKSSIVLSTEDAILYAINDNN
jgi:hypothetical protein